MKELAHAHGGDLDAIEKIYNIPKEEIIDFSGNINPLGFPKKVNEELSRNIHIVSTYPDRRYEKLRKNIGKYTGANFEHIVVGNGSTELISTFIKTVNAKKTIILGPAYSEYENTAKLCGGDYEYFALEEKNNFVVDFDKLINTLNEDIDLFIACNPNNPTGTVITTKQMDKLLDHCKKNKTYVMVDETYIEFSDKLHEICSIPLVEKYDNLFVIRGISKFFAAPGLRLGYAICSNDKFLETLKNIQDPWSVNSLATFAGERLFNDKEFIEETKNLISSERQKAFNILSNIKNIKAYPSDSNFILIKLLTDKIKASQIYENLIKQNMLIRDASSFTFLDESYIRFCIMQPEDNKKLFDNLELLLK